MTAQKTEQVLYQYATVYFNGLIGWMDYGLIDSLSKEVLYRNNRQKILDKETRDRCLERGRETGKPIMQVCDQIKFSET